MLDNLWTSPLSGLLLFLGLAFVSIKNINCNFLKLYFLSIKIIKEKKYYILSYL